MNRLLTLLTIASLLLVPAVAIGHELDHPALGFSNGVPASSALLAGGEDAEWELVTSIPTGNPHTDLDFFTQDGVTYASVGTLAAGANGGGQTIVKLMDADGTVAPEFVSAHPSAQCGTAGSPTGLQHDVEAAPKGEVILNTTNLFADTSDTQLLLDATDANGRCHDQDTSAGGPNGGLEIIDVTDLETPKEIALTSHIGEAHTVNVDPKRPHIAYVVTSDSTSVDTKGTPFDFSDDTRGNEASGDALDGWEMVDLSSCMDFPDGTSIEDRRATCQPEVFRFRYPTTEIIVGHTNLGNAFGCHELEVYPDDRLTCASGDSMILFDMSAAFDDRGTPTDFSDDTINGEPLACTLRDSISGGVVATGAKVTDCTVTPDGDSLQVSGWLDDGAPSVEGIEHIGSAHHQGDFGADFAPDEDISFDHEAELTESRDFVIASDERGGGLTPGDASCAVDNAVNSAGNGGLSAYAVDRLDAIGEFPESADEAFDAYARTPEGEKAIIRITPRAAGPTFCTAHVFQQIPGQNRIFMGWYTQGTQVVDFIEHPDGSFEFIERAYFIPENANTWTSHVFDVQENADGTFTYTGATGDFNLATAGRNTIDIFRVTLPPAPEPRVQDPTDTPSEDGDEVVRLAGDTRITTAIDISQDRFPDDGSAGAVVLSRGDDPTGFADALAGGPLAVDRDAPLLVTPPDQLDDDVAAEIDRVLDDGDTVFLLGGDQALSTDVEQALDDAGYDTVRLAGGTRYETAIAIADELGNPDLTLIATGDTFVDALAASAAGGANTGAVLLTPSEQRHPSTDAYLDEHDPDRLVAVGGPAARPYTEAEQVIGADRFATATELADLLFDDPTVVGIARSDRFPDALAGGAHVGALGGPILLSTPDELDPTTEDHLCDHADVIDLAYLYGGELALDDDVRDAVETAIDDDSTC